MELEEVATELAATIQAGHIRVQPDINVDAAPSTAADKKEPVTLHNPRLDDDLLHDIDGDDDDEDIPYSVLRPAKKKPNSLPPLPDLRFEQSYLRSIANAKTWYQVLLITARDQVMMPLAQGIVYNVLLCGWQHWNRSTRLHGNTLGSRVRRWWYGVNAWPVPRRKTEL